MLFDRNRRGSARLGGHRDTITAGRVRLVRHHIPCRAGGGTDRLEGGPNRTMHDVLDRLHVGWTVVNGDGDVDRCAVGEVQDGITAAEVNVGRGRIGADGCETGGEEEGGEYAR